MSENSRTNVNISSTILWHLLTILFILIFYYNFQLIPSNPILLPFSPELRSFLMGNWAETATGFITPLEGPYFYIFIPQKSSGNFAMINIIWFIH